MAFKISSERLIKIDKLLNRAYTAINTLERSQSSQILYPDLKKEISEMIETLESTYDLKNFEEWEEKKPQNKATIKKKE